jgi:hypothetical protein
MSYTPRIRILQTTSDGQHTSTMKADDELAGPSLYVAAKVSQTKSNRLTLLQLLDYQAASWLNLNTISHPSEITGNLPGDEDLWNAPDSATWATLMQRKKKPDPPPFPTILSCLLQGAELTEPINDYSTSIIAYILHR